MQVIKKDGRLEEFHSEKIGTSVANSGLDVGVKLSDSEIRLIEKDVVNLLFSIRANDLKTSFLEISAAVIYVLRKTGYRVIADNFEKGLSDIEIKGSFKVQNPHHEDNDSDTTKLYRKEI